MSGLLLAHCKLQLLYLKIHQGKPTKQIALELHTHTVVNRSEFHTCQYFCGQKSPVMRREHQETRAEAVRNGLACQSWAVAVAGGALQGMAWHTLYGDDTGHRHTQHGRPRKGGGGGRGRTAMTVEDTVGGTGARSHLKGRRGVQLKLLIRELRKATRSETKGAR